MENFSFVDVYAEYGGIFYLEEYNTIFINQNNFTEAKSINGIIFISDINNEIIINNSIFTNIQAYSYAFLIE